MTFWRDVFFNNVVSDKGDCSGDLYKAINARGVGLQTIFGMFFFYISISLHIQYLHCIRYKTICDTLFVLTCHVQVDGALSLVRLGKEKRIPGLQLLSDDLVTLETLVYEAGCDVSLTLKDLLQIKEIDKLRLLMENVCLHAC